MNPEPTPSSLAPRDPPSGRGRAAGKPTEVPPQGWLDILARTARQTSANNLPLVAAGVGFYAFLAVAPTLAAVIGLYALFADPSQVSENFDALARGIPHEVVPLLKEQIQHVMANNHQAGISAIVGLVLAIYSSSSAMRALITGLNIAYRETERRGFVKLYTTSLLLTAGALVGIALAAALLIAMPVALDRFGASSTLQMLLSWLRWPFLAGAFAVALAVVYRFGPCRDKPQWRWLSWGAAVGCVLWLLASAGFAFYASKFGNYDKTYGALGAVVVFLFWLFLTAFASLLGAKLNAEMERQTVKDTTEGAPQPLGQRNAEAADTVGPTRSQQRPAPSA